MAAGVHGERSSGRRGVEVFSHLVFLFECNVLLPVFP